MMRNQICVVITAAEAAALFVLLLCFLFVPVDIGIRFMTPVYEDRIPENGEYAVYLRSLYGYWYNVQDEPEFVRTNDGYLVKVSHGRFSREFLAGVCPIVSLRAVYDGIVYAGEAPEEKKVTVDAVYEDGSAFHTTGGVKLPEKVDGTWDGFVVTPYGCAVLHIECIGVKEVFGVFTGQAYPGLSVEDSDFYACVRFMDGTRKDGVSLWISDSVYAAGDQRILIKTAYGNTYVSVSTEPVRSMVVYGPDIYEGHSERREHYILRMFADKKEYDLPGMLCLTDHEILYDSQTISTVYGDASRGFDCIRAVSADILYDGPALYEGDLFPAESGAVLVYEDGHRADAMKDGAEWVLSGSPVLSVGTNRFGLLWNDREFFVSLEAKKSTPAHNAYLQNRVEYESADWKYLTDNLYVAVHHIDTGVSSYELAHIVMNDVSQLCCGLSHDSYGGTRECPSEAALRQGWVIGINASMFSYATGMPNTSDLKIKNGCLMPDSLDQANGLEIVLDRNGCFWQPAQYDSAESVFSRGALNTFDYGDPALIENGAVMPLIKDYRYPHTAVGMVRPGEYYFLAASSGSYSRGTTYAELQNLFLSKRCVFAGCLDGGGSSAMVFEGRLINRITGSKERAVSDFIYVTDNDSLNIF